MDGSFPQAPSQPLQDLQQAWPPRAQSALALLLLLALVLIGWQALVSGRLAGRPSTLDAGLLTLTPINVNTASAAELTRIPGIGPRLAERIIEQRQKSPFSRIEDIRQVPGMGPKTFARIRAWLKVSDEVTATTVSRRIDLAAAEPVLKGAGKKEQALAGRRININQASPQELQLLPGIGPKLSERIISERSRRPFASVDELRRVYGIGAKMLEKLRPWVTVE